MEKAKHTDDVAAVASTFGLDVGFVRESMNAVKQALVEYETTKAEMANAVESEKHLRVEDLQERAAWDAFALEFIKTNLPRTTMLTPALCDEAAVFAKLMIERRREAFFIDQPLDDDQPVEHANGVKTEKK